MTADLGASQGFVMKKNPVTTINAAVAPSMKVQTYESQHLQKVGGT